MVVTDLNGTIYVWSAASGSPPARRWASTRRSPQDDVAAQDERNRTKPGFAAQPALGDLDGDGTLEIVAGALDRHLYAWHDDGTPVEGFPVLARRPGQGAGGRPGHAQGDVHRGLRRRRGR